MSIQALQIDELAHADDEALAQLTDVLIDCVEGGASVSFMLPLDRAHALDFWRRVARDADQGRRLLLVARDALGICGTVQLILDLPDNQPHRADVAKMLVHRRARRQGAGATLMRARPRRAREAATCWCSIASPAAMRRGCMSDWDGCAWVTFPATRCGRAADSWARRTTTATCRPDRTCRSRERRPPATPPRWTSTCPSG